MYRRRHPTSASLIIEVSRSSRKRDLTIKARIYAQANVADYWVVDLAKRQVVVHRGPADGRYLSVTRHRDGRLRPLHHPGVELDVAWVF